MQSHDPKAAPRSVSTSAGSKPAAGRPGAGQNPGTPWDVLTNGTGTTVDPQGTDTRQPPPGVALPGTE